MYVIGTCVPDFQNSLHIRCRLSYITLLRYQSPFFELLLKERMWAGEFGTII